MRLTDVVGHAGLAIWAQIAFVLFALVFLAVVVRVMITKRPFNERMSRMPLEDDEFPVDLDPGSETGVKARS